MPEPLKNRYNHELISSLSKQLSKAYKQFDSDGFLDHVFDDAWETKELKERMRHVSESLHQFLPKNYSKATKILMDASSEFSGFEFMFFPDFVELYGLDKYEESITALEHFTKYSSSEFAVRPFIKKYNSKMMKQMQAWAKSNNEHVRRLASEGCRPRLPWAMALPEFKKDPRPILIILEKLKNDDSEYVRRSVANNLNDISKDNPKLVIETAKKWLGDNPQTDWIIKHACRTLLKQGEPEVMNMFGLSQPKHIKVTDFKVNKNLTMGNKMDFSFILKSRKGKLGKLRLEYAIDFLKKNNTQSRKIFKISESMVTESEKSISKSHSFKKISTRVYYPGIHGIAIIINGHEMISDKFIVK